MKKSKIIQPIPEANELVRIWRNYGQNTYPIDVRILIEGFINQKYQNEKIEIVTEDFDSIEGALVKKPDNQWALIYNKNITNIGRQNFTIAHELGHYLCHRLLQDSFNCGDKELYRSNEAIEKEANLFASYLLMPIDDFKIQIENQEISFDLFKHCAARYKTSLTAVIIKWLEFTNNYAVLVVSIDGFISWSRSSDLAFKNGIYFKSTTELPNNSFAKSNKNYQFIKNPILQKGVWHEKYSVKEFSFYSEDYDTTFTLLIFQNVSDYKYDYKENEEKDCADCLNRLK